MDENGLYAMLAQVFRLAIRDAHQLQNRILCQEARSWLWDVAPYIAQKGDVPRPEEEVVTVSISALLWVAQLPVFSELVVNADERLELCQSFKADTEQELRGALRNYRGGDRLTVKRLPNGGKWR